VREGDYSQRISQVIEIWKGRYKDEAVALKVFKVSHHDPQLSAFKKVSMPWDPCGGLLFILIFDSGWTAK